MHLILNIGVFLFFIGVGLMLVVNPGAVMSADYLRQMVSLSEKWRPQATAAERRVYVVGRITMVLVILGVVTMIISRLFG